jgi:hypothetical protein
MLPRIQTERLGNQWATRIQIQIYSEDTAAASWQWGPRGYGDTPDAAIADAKARTIASLLATADLLRQRVP